MMGFGMMSGTGFAGGWGMAFGGLMMIVWIALLVAVVVLVVRWLSGPGTRVTSNGGGANPDRSQSSALALLQERYARGEIETADFEERTKKLRAAAAS